MVPSHSHVPPSLDVVDAIPLPQSVVERSRVRDWGLENRKKISQFGCVESSHSPLHVVSIRSSMEEVCCGEKRLGRGSWLWWWLWRLGVVVIWCWVRAIDAVAMARVTH